MKSKLSDKTKKIIKYLGNFITIISIFYIVFTISKMNLQLDSIDHISVLFLVIALGAVTTFCGLVLLTYAWKIPLECFGDQKILMRQVLPIYLKANLGKYLPGNIAHYIERNMFAVGLGLNQFYIVLSSALECVVIILTAFLLSTLFAFNSLLTVFKNIANFKLILIVLVFTLLMYFIIKRSKKIQDFWLKIQGQISIKKLYIMLGKMFAIYAIELYTSAIFLPIACKYILNVNLDLKQFLYLMVCYVLAWMVGYCTPGSPGGIGVREFVIILLAGSIIGRENIFVAAIIQRIISVLGDIMGYLIAIILSKCDHKKFKI